MAAPFAAPTFDQSPVITATLADLDLDEVARHLEAARTTGRYRGQLQEAMPFLLEQCAVVELESTIIPTVAGILFFGRHPQHYLPYATIKLAHYRGDEINSNEVRHIDEYGGNIRHQIDRAVDYLNDHIEHGYILTSGAQRQEQPQYPPSALRELTVNATAHRDYTVLASSTRIAMFRSRIEWSSPGKLPQGITPDNILDMQFARNPYLTQLLYQSGYVEAYGQGIDTVFNVLRTQGLPLPTMREAGNTFIISIMGHQPTGLSTAHLTGLTDPQLQIVAIVQTLRSANARDLMEALPARSERSIQYDLKQLVDRGILQRVGKGRAVSYLLAKRESY
jgi:ATP-dependent DNA helicase RecG